MPTNMQMNDVAPEAPALELRDLLPKEEMKPLTAEEAWNSSPYPATRPMWNVEGREKTDNRGETMRRAIMEDPFAPFDRELLPQLSLYAGESPEGAKNAIALAKKMTAARFLANAVNIDFPDAVANFPALASAFFGEQIDDPNLVYAKLREIYQAEFAPRPGLSERLGRDVNTGVLAAGKGFPDMANAAIETGGIVGDALNYGINKPLEWLSRKAGWEGGALYFGQFADARYQKRSPWLDEIAENYRKEMNYQQEQRGPASGFGEELTGAVIQNLPNTLLSLMFAEAKLFGTIGATSAYFGATSFAGELSDTRDDRNMSEGGRIANALVVGAAETVFEEKLGMGRIARKYFRTGIPAAEARKLSTAFGATLARTGKALGMDAGGEGFEEILTGATQRFSNLVANRDGKTLAGMSATELFHELCDPMPLEFSTGAVIGGGVGAAGIGGQFRRQRTQAQIHNFRAGVFGEARQELEKLRAKESPTEEDVRVMETLDGALKSGDVLPVLNLEAERLLSTQEEARLDELPTGEWAEELAAKAVRQEKELQADRRLKPAELAAAPVTEAVWRELEELQREYGGAVEVELANTPEALPEHIRNAPNYTPGAEGAFDPSTGKIWLVGGNLEPGRVKKVLLHEAVGHKGLRNVFGAKYDVFLDAIARDFEADVSALAGKREIDFTTGAGRLEAADEFLAARAENIEENPKLWKRVTAAVRRWLRTLPGLHELRYTDAEIQSLLRRANRAVKKGAPGTRADGVRFSADPGTEVRAVRVPDVGIDFSDTVAARQYLRDHFQGMELEVKSDGRLVLITGRGAYDAAKKRGVHREAFPALDRLITEAYPAGYRAADEAEKHSHLNGQYIYASLAELNGELYAARILLNDSKNDSRAHFKDITLKKIKDALFHSSSGKPAGSSDASLSDGGIPSAALVTPDRSGEIEVGPPGTSPSSVINIKRLVELVNPETDGNQENADGIRFSVSPEYSRRVNRLAQILAPHTKNGQEMLEEAEAAALLQNAGIEIDAEADQTLLHEAAWQARELIRERNNKVKTKSEEAHLRKKDPYYAALSEKYGPDFTISPGPAYEGRKFTGTWVDKRKLPKNQTGVKLAEAARAVSDATGKTVAESAVMEYFADLKREALLKDMRDTKARRRELKTAAEEMAEAGIQGQKAASFLAERNRWVYDTYPFIRAAVDFGGDKFLIVPSMRYEGAEFSGSWISPAWKSGSVRKNNNKTGLAAIEADGKRLDKLSGAEGIHSNELAQAIARREGGDPLAIEDRLIEFFQDLKKQEVFRRFYAERADSAERAAELEREAKAGEKEARTSAESNARADEYKALLDEALKDKLDIVRVQQLAAAYARRNLKKELRGEFIQRVADLSKYTADISPAYPNGRRMHELEKLLADMQTFDIVDRIGELLDKYKPTVNRTGQRISPIGDAEQETLAQIRAILAMPPHAVANRIAELSEQLNAVSEESSEQGKEQEEELELLRIFGAMERKSRDDAWGAFRMLSALIEGKRESFLNRLREKREDLGRKQYQAVIETTGNEDGLPRTGKSDTEPKRSRYVLMQRNLRGLLELVTNRSDKEFDETVLGQLFSRLEESTWKNATFDRESNTRAEQAIERIFRIDTIAKKAAFWREAEKTVEQTGIFVDRYSRPRQYAQNRFGLVDGRGFYTASITPENAKKLLQNAEDGKAELDPLAAEFLRQQLDDFEHGVEQEWQLFGNEDENSAFNAFVKRSRKEQKLTVFHPDKNAEKERVELAVSKAEGATLLMAWEQPDVQARMRWNGWTDESIEQLKQFIGPEFIEFARWSRQDIAETGKKLDAASRSIYGIGLPGLVNYYPVSYKETLGKQIGKGKTESYLGYGYGQMSVNPTFLIKRKFHLSDVDVHRSIFQAHLQHQIEVNHFLSWGESIREARGILNNRQVRQAISGTYGTEVYNQILDRVTVLANAGRDSGQAVELMGRLFRYWVPSKIALNFSSVLKQFAGSVSYMNEVPVADFMKNFAETFSGSEDFRRFAEYATGGDFYKDRRQGGFSRDLMYLTKSNRSGKIADVYGNALIDKGTYLTRWADSVSALRGGYAAFKYHYDNLLARGMEPGAAWEEAARRWKRATDETQQSGYLKDQNRFQSDAGAYRYLTSFLSNPIQIMNLELMTIDDIRFGKGKRREEALKKLPRQIFVNHVMLPTMMVLVTQLFRKGFDYDEYEWEDFVTASLLGPFDGAFMAGKVLQAAADSFGGLMLGRGWRPGQTVAEALPMFDDAILGGVRMEKLAMELLEGGQPDGAEYYGAVQGMADMLMTAGTVLPLPYAGAGGATGSALMRELKRLWRLFGSSEAEKPKLKF